MTGWKADGRTAPSFRSCPHDVVIVGRCFVCRAVRVDGYVQSAHLGMGGLPIGSPLLQEPMTKAMPLIKGDGTSRARFNRPIKP